MKSIFVILILSMLLLNLNPVMAEENEYGVVEAWFNGKNATLETIEGVKLKISEPVEVKVTITSKINGHIFVKLKEPGVTKVFDVLTGPSKQDERIDNLNIFEAWSKTYTWKIAPNGAWKNGNAPINIFVQFSKQANDKIIQFTIANPYILDEQYTGAVPTTVPSPRPTGSPASTKQAPFVPVLVALSAFILAWRWAR
jgi:sarcinarray family protein